MVNAIRAHVKEESDEDVDEVTETFGKLMRSRKEKTGSGMCHCEACMSSEKTEASGKTKKMPTMTSSPPDLEVGECMCMDCQSKRGHTNKTEEEEEEEEDEEDVEEHERVY